MLAVLLLVALAGCGTVSRAVRLDTGEGKALVFTPRGGESPVQLGTGEFTQSLAELARDVQPATNPLQHARRLMFDSFWHEEVYLKWTGQRLELDSGAELAQEPARLCLDMTNAYGRGVSARAAPETASRC